MSRIGNAPVKIPEKVEVKIDGRKISVKGEKGELNWEIPKTILVKIENNEITFSRQNEKKETRALHGLSRALVANLIVGVSTGFEKKLEINGVGYRAEGGGDSINLQLGFSHPVKMDAPAGVKIEIDKDKKNLLIISGIEKQKVGKFAAQIRKLRPPEPYKGKGIKYIDEHIVRKVGKRAGAK